MLDVEKLIGGFHEYVERAFAPLVERVKALEARQPERGEKGIDGKDGAAGLDGKDGADGRSIKGEPGDKGEKGEPGQNGAKGDPGEPGPAGKDGAPGLPGTDGKPGDPGENGKDGGPGADGLKGADGVNGKDGRDGVDGKDGAPGSDGQKGVDGLNGKDGAPGAEGQKGADGINGKDGAPGERGEKGLDGKSVTLDDIRPLFEAEVAKALLDFERRAGDVLQRGIDRLPVPKDGADGLGFDDMSAVKKDARTIVFTFSRGDRTKTFEFTFPVVLDAGVFELGKTYEEGDAPTYGGSIYVAQRKTLPGERPGDGSDAFRLAVKRGKDGKDATA